MSAILYCGTRRANNLLLTFSVVWFIHILFIADNKLYNAGGGWVKIGSTVVARWTADQQVKRLILHQGHDS